MLELMSELMFGTLMSGKFITLTDITITISHKQYIFLYQRHKTRRRKEKYDHPRDIIQNYESWVLDDYLLLGSVTSYHDRKFDQRIDFRVYKLLSLLYLFIFCFFFQSSPKHWSVDNSERGLRSVGKLSK